MFNPISTIINKIKNKDKELEGMFVITDELGKIIAFSKCEKELQHYIGQYNLAKDFQSLRKYEFSDLKIRNKIKRIL